MNRPGQSNQSPQTEEDLKKALLYALSWVVYLVSLVLIIFGIQPVLGFVVLGLNVIFFIILFFK